jgi:hypothetical protein
MRFIAMEDRVRAGERGFALVLAILSLMLLTFLGLTLATTTSTELQIATNYRWSQQALYNAEAGLEAARIVLSNVADISAGWRDQLPTARTTPWVEGSAPVLTGGTDRDYYKSNCDTVARAGYGRVIYDADSDIRYENVSSFAGQTLNGAFTVWIRRNLLVGNDGKYSDDPRNDALTIVSEGVAPYTGPGEAFTQARQATRVLETRFTLAFASVGEPCLGTQAGQEGGSPMGENFNPCAPITAGAAGSLANAFGGAEAGTLDSKGVE